MDKLAHVAGPHAQCIAVARQGLVRRRVSLIAGWHAGTMGLETRNARMDWIDCTSTVSERANTESTKFRMASCATRGQTRAPALRATAHRDDFLRPGHEPRAGRELRSPRHALRVA